MGIADGLPSEPAIPELQATIRVGSRDGVALPLHTRQWQKLHGSFIYNRISTTFSSDKPLTSRDFQRFQVSVSRLSRGVINIQIIFDVRLFPAIEGCVHSTLLGGWVGVLG